MSKPPAHRLRRAVPGILLTAYVLFIFVVTLTPRMPASATVGSVVTRALDRAHRAGIARWADFLTVEFAGNILMFVPLGILTAVVMGWRRWWLLLVAGPALSVFVELSQLLLLPTRFSEFRDIVSNTIGYLLGLAAARLMQSIRSRRRADRHGRASGTTRRHGQ